MPRPALPAFDDLRRPVLIVALTALAYGLAALLSLKLSTYVAGVAAAVWLAAGIGAAASLRFGLPGVAGVLLGSFAANSLGSPPELAFAIACGAAAGAWFMHALAQRLAPFSTTLDYVSSVAKFALLIAPMGSAVSACVGVTSLHVLGSLSADMLPRALWVWWLGDILGIYLIAPILMTASRWDLLPTSKRARLEGLALVLGMLVLTRVLLQVADPLRPAEIVLFVLLPGVLWAALRFSVTGASLAIFLAAPIVLGMALVSYGGINAKTQPQDVFALQMSMMMMALGGLFVIDRFFFRG